MKHLVSSFIVLALLWLGNSGHYSGLLLGLGLASVITVVWISHRMRVIDHESQPISLSARKLAGYYIWLSGKILSSNVDVVRRVWGGNRTLSPTLETLPMTQQTTMGRVIYANSITLTPGTVAMDLEEGQVLVHSLTREGIEDLRQGEMGRRVTDLEVSP
jgi:multicomponent Na+:H+ antiporter subunit E